MEKLVRGEIGVILERIKLIFSMVCKGRGKIIGV